MSKTNFLHTLSDENQEGVELPGTQGTTWRPAIALPMYVGFGLKKSKCGCGLVFNSDEAFKAHYIYQAVWQSESGYIPKLLAKAKK